jgi:Ca2+/H+ antiporter, TMEM165/GDT1 family
VIDALADAGWAGYLLVFLAAATPVLEILLVIPAGIAVGLSPVPVALLALAGNATTVAMVTLAGDRLRAWWRRRRGSERAPAGAAAGAHAAVGTGVDASAAPEPADPSGGRGGRARRIAERWGVPGLALIAPLVTGSHIGAMAALGLGAHRTRVLGWMIAGLAVWTVVTTLAAVLGLELLGLGGT